ncbi:hypothetical protein CPB86DRAFT_828892 [Serendipita vermifera]|nr:hypothetical protein CPB86DRAFT_828892 [Serendipita vermifera]
MRDTAQRAVLPELPAVLVAKPAPDFSQFSFSQIGKETHGRPSILKARLGIGVPPPNFRADSALSESSTQVQDAVSDEEMEKPGISGSNIQLDENVAAAQNLDPDVVESSSGLASQHANTVGSVSLSLPLSEWLLPGSPEKIKLFHFQPLWEDAESVRREWASVERPEITNEHSMSISPQSIQEIPSQSALTFETIIPLSGNTPIFAPIVSQTQQAPFLLEPSSLGTSRVSDSSKQESTMLRGTTDILKLSNTLENVRTAGKTRAAGPLRSSDVQDSNLPTIPVSLQRADTSVVKASPHPLQQDPPSRLNDNHAVHSKTKLLGPRINTEKPVTIESNTIKSPPAQPSGPETRASIERAAIQHLDSQSPPSKEYDTRKESEVTQNESYSNASENKQQAETRSHQGPAHRERSTTQTLPSFYRERPPSDRRTNHDGRHDIPSHPLYTSHGRPQGRPSLEHRLGRPEDYGSSRSFDPAPYRPRAYSPGRRVRRDDWSPPQRGEPPRRLRTPPPRGPWSHRGRSYSRSLSRSRSRSRSYSPPPRSHGLYGLPNRDPPYPRGFTPRERSRSRSPPGRASSIRSRISSPRSRPLSIGRRSASPPPRSFADRIHPGTRPLQGTQGRERVTSGPVLNPTYGDRHSTSDPSRSSLAISSRDMHLADTKLDHKLHPERVVTPSEPQRSGHGTTQTDKEMIPAQSSELTHSKAELRRIDNTPTQNQDNNQEASLSSSLKLKRARENDPPAHGTIDDPFLNEPSAKRRHFPSPVHKEDKRVVTDKKQDSLAQTSKAALVSKATSALVTSHMTFQVNGANVLTSQEQSSVTQLTKGPIHNKLWQRMAGNSPDPGTSDRPYFGHIPASSTTPSQNVHSRLLETFPEKWPLTENGVPSPATISLPTQPLSTTTPLPANPQPFIPPHKTYKPLAERMDIGYSKVKMEEKPNGLFQGAMASDPHLNLPTKPHLLDRLDSQGFPRQTWQPPESAIPSLQSRLNTDQIDGATNRRDFKTITPTRNNKNSPVNRTADTGHSPSLQSRLR